MIKMLLAIVLVSVSTGCAYGGEATEKPPVNDAGSESPLDCEGVPSGQTVMCAYNPVTNTGKCTTQSDAGLVECPWSCCY